MAGVAGDVRVASLLERPIGALDLFLVGGAVHAEQVVEVVAMVDYIGRRGPAAGEGIGVELPQWWRMGW